MGRVGKKVFLAMILTMLAGCLGGCMGKSRKIVSYMEERYNKTFTYVGETNGIFGSKAFTARLSCEDDPEADILASWQEQDGEEYYLDNYMAFRHHEAAYQKIDEAVGQVFSDYQLIFRVPDVLLCIEEPEDYTLESYLADPLAFKSIRIVTRENVDEASFQALVKTFMDADITVKGVVAVPEDPQETSEITEENVDIFLANKSRVRTQVNFKVENGTLINEDWRQ